jgi:hypothetical protein
MQLAYWGMSLYMGVGRTQNRASEVISDVRDTGGGYKVKGGRGYNTNPGLDFHQDSCDVVVLLCRRTAREGGTSKVMSSLALHDRVMELRPDLLPVLQNENWSGSTVFKARKIPASRDSITVPSSGIQPESVTRQPIEKIRWRHSTIFQRCRG